jgi:hypothetical protein
MNFQITKDRWSDFFETLSKRRYEWRTRIEVLNADLGDQVLSDGLPFNGVTAESNQDRVSIQISVAKSPESHQSHSIENPTRVAFLPASDSHGDVIDIEEADGTKTLISFIGPAGIIVGYKEIGVIASAV